MMRLYVPQCEEPQNDIPVTHISILDDTYPCQPDHSYLRSHALGDIPCRVYLGIAEFGGHCFHGAIAAPLHDIDGHHVDTLLLKKGPCGERLKVCVNNLQSRGASVRIGALGSGPILILLDYESAQSCHLATMFPVASACQADNLAAVCEALAERYKDTRRVLCIDATINEKQRRTLQEVAANTGTYVITLNLTEQEVDSINTFNDVHRRYGLDAVARQFRGVCPGEGNQDHGGNMIESPWPYPVFDGSDLFRRIIKAIRDYTILSRQMAIAIALWVIFSYTIQITRIAPILLIYSALKRCGKTTLGSLLAYLAYRPSISSNISTAALYREIEDQQPTLIIDEMETFIHSSSDLIGIINSGHTRSTAFVVRSIGGRNKRFNVYCAKIFMMIGFAPETIRDRSIEIFLERKRANQRTKPLDAEVRPRELTILQMQIARWAQDNIDRIAEASIKRPNLNNDRASDNWGPLLTIAQCLGDECYAAALDAAAVLTRSEDLSLDEYLLRDIKTAFEGARCKKLSSAELIRSLCSDLEKPWATLNRGQPITPCTLAVRLKIFGIASKNIRDNRGEVVKGYEFAQFEDAFARYVLDVTK